MEFADKISNIYNLLGDDLSKYIFENRLMYSLTSDTNFLRKVVYTIKEAEEIYRYLKTTHKKIGLFGAGRAGRYLKETFVDVEFECYIDNNQVKNMCKGLPVISVQEFKKRYPDGIILITTRFYYEEMIKQLFEEGFREEQILNVGLISDKLAHLQYFDLPQLQEKRLQKEIFVDGGCFVGDSSVNFFNWCSGDGFVYAWEPDPTYVKQCKQTFETNRIPYQLIPKGLWNEPKQLQLKVGKGCSMITDGAWDIKIEVDSMDRLIKEPVTFIKMDVEGSEYEALLGGSKIISQYKPKLAISIYHKLEDIWKLPWLIHELNPDYMFYLRHYSFSWSETVLYAL